MPTRPDPAPGSARQATPGIRFNDRVIVFGSSGSGKSTLINHLAAGVTCQVLIWDSKDELIVPGVTPVEDPARIRWKDRIIHVVDDTCDLENVSRLFDLCWQRKATREEISPDGAIPRGYGLVVVVHELGDVCLDQPNRAPRSFINFAKKGRQRALGLIAGSQRPVNIPRTGRTEVQHVMTFAGGLDPDDLPVVAKMHRMPAGAFEHALADTQARYGEHAFIWHNRRLNTNTIKPPLPDHLRNQTIAHIIEQEHPDRGAP